jgi:ketosteroid isomerase-like protein
MPLSSAKLATGSTGTMPTRKRVQDFIARVESGAFVQAIEEFYHPDASMQENTAPPRVGRDTLVAYEKAVLARYPNTRVLPAKDALIDGDRVVIHWVFVLPDAAGSVLRPDELALQDWNGERIAREQFFYDPAQLTPAKSQ